VQLQVQVPCAGSPILVRLALRSKVPRPICSPTCVCTCMYACLHATTADTHSWTGVHIVSDNTVMVSQV
jgi:hypothetical protein